MVGIGYDIHRLVRDRPLFLGGIKIEHNKGLAGHSDGDVLLHAICDALLGAANLGDIGEHFPPRDDQYKNIASSVLLGEVRAFLKKSGFLAKHIDAIVIAEYPKLSPYKTPIREKIAQIMQIQTSSISIKAKTNEGIGPIGEGTAIAAWAVCELTNLYDPAQG